MKDKIIPTSLAPRYFEISKSGLKHSASEFLLPKLETSKDHLHKTQLMSLQKKLKNLYETKTSEWVTKSTKENLDTLRSQLLADLGNVSEYSRRKAGKMAQNLYRNMNGRTNLLMEVSKGRNYLLRMEELKERQQRSFQKRWQKMRKLADSQKIRENSMHD